MFVAVEEHERHGVKQLVHLVEIRYFSDVHHVKHHKVAELIGYLHDYFVHLHAVGVPIVTETDHH